MKQLLIALTVALSGLTIGFAPIDAEAKRLGGGKSAGMQRQAPPQQPNTPPAQPNNAAPVAGAAAPAAAGATAAAAAGKRSWMGPIAGIAAGLGIAALLSHLGMGEAFANMLTMILLAAVAFFVIRWLLRRFAGGQAGAQGAQRARPGDLQFAGANQGNTSPFGMPRSSVESPSAAPAGGSSAWAGPTGAAAAQPAGAAAAVSMPPDFDAEAFERVAKMIFIRLQAANDAGQVDDLRKFTTPELFSSLRLDLQERGGTVQQTDVVQLDAQLLETAQEDGQWIATVRFHGLIREQADAGAEPFDELWHLVKPVDGGREWAIAGISPNTATH